MPSRRRLPDLNQRLRERSLASTLVSERFGEIGPTHLHRWFTTTSFLAFLIEHYGAARLKLVYHAPSAQLHEAYGVPLQALETEWRRALE